MHRVRIPAVQAIENFVSVSASRFVAVQEVIEFSVDLAQVSLPDELVVIEAAVAEEIDTSAEWDDGALWG